MDILITHEQRDDIRSILKDSIKYDGIRKASKIVNGLDNLFMIFEINTPIEFLNLFNDLEMVKSQENPYLTLFRYRPGHNIMVTSSEYYNNLLAIIWDDVWEILWDYFKMEQTEIQKLTLRWVKDAYQMDNIDKTIDLRNEDYIKSL